MRRGYRVDNATAAFCPRLVVYASDFRWPALIRVARVLNKGEVRMWENLLIKPSWNITIGYLCLCVSFRQQYGK